MDNKCSICGGILTQFGSRNIKDGIVCRYCAKKASPWLNDDDYLKRDAEAFKKHLEYREKNKEKIAKFVPEKEVKGKYTLYLDEDNGEFVISKRKDYKRDNADVLLYKDIISLTIFEELDETGKNYNLLMDIKLRNKEIDNVCFRVNEFPGLQKESKEYKEALDKAYEYLNGVESVNGIDFVEV